MLCASTACPPSRQVRAPTCAPGVAPVAVNARVCARSRARRRCEAGAAYLDVLPGRVGGELGVQEAAQAGRQLGHEGGAGRDDAGVPVGDGRDVSVPHLRRYLAPHLHAAVEGYTMPLTYNALVHAQ